MRDRIMDAAEARMRWAGFNAVSFRDIANEVGVKSASVHYHFPTKEDLGVALVERYAERQFDALDAATKGVGDPTERVKALAALHRDAFVEGKSICLCAMLSAESIGLPERVASAVKAFYDGSLNWLKDSFAGDPAAATRAESVFAALQGGLLIAAVSRDGAHMRRAAAGAVAMATAPMNRADEQGQ
ncbi:MAG: TetR/AcrR family transcriptional regulator [Pseudomonadota bacterium]